MNQNGTISEVSAFIALWLQIHGGDPQSANAVTVEQAVEAATSIAAMMSGYAASLVRPQGRVALDEAGATRALERTGFRRVDSAAQGLTAAACWSPPGGTGLVFCPPSHHQPE